MQKELTDLFKTDPHVDIKRVKQKSKKSKKRKAPTFDEIEAATGVRPVAWKTVPCPMVYFGKNVHSYRTYSHRKAKKLALPRLYAQHKRTIKMNIIKGTKICITCKEELSLAAFDFLGRKGKHNPKSGLRKSYCYKCRKINNAEYYQDNKTKHKITSDKRYEDNKELRKAQMKAHYKRKKDAEIAYRLLLKAQPETIK